MESHEVEEAFRVRSRVVRAEIDASLGDSDYPNIDRLATIPNSILRRVHRGLKPDELELYAADAGGPDNPAWLSVVVTPYPPAQDIFDPTEIRAEVLQRLVIDEPWYNQQQPLTHFYLTPTLQGFYAQIPHSDEVAPAYLVHFWPDGLMEFGTSLVPALLDENPARNVIVPTLSVAEYERDFIVLFAEALAAVEYTGEVLAQIGFDNIKDWSLGVGAGYDFGRAQPIREMTVEGPLWKGSASNLKEAAGGIVKKAMDRLFLAGGIDTLCYFLDEDGNRTE